MRPPAVTSTCLHVGKSHLGPTASVKGIPLIWPIRQLWSEQNMDDYFCGFPNQGSRSQGILCLK